MSESVSPVIEGMGEHIKRTVELLEKTDLDGGRKASKKTARSARQWSARPI